jgi:hypothetical protein
MEPAASCRLSGVGDIPVRRDPPETRPGRRRAPGLQAPAFLRIDTGAMTEKPPEPPLRVLDPMDRISEILFGLIMVLTYTSTLSVMTADKASVRTMLLGALGCNLAWGIIDAGLHLMARLSERGRNNLTLRAVQNAAPEAGRRAISDALPEPLVPAVSADQLETMRQQLRLHPEPPERPRLTREDWLGALGICLIVFLSTLPVVIPFLFIGDVRLALRLSNAVAIVMMFLCGYAFGRHAGIRTWPMGLIMVAIGSGLTGIAIALGG